MYTHSYSSYAIMKTSKTYMKTSLKVAMPKELMNEGSINFPSVL